MVYRTIITALASQKIFLIHGVCRTWRGLGCEGQMQNTGTEQKVAPVAAFSFKHIFCSFIHSNIEVEVYRVKNPAGPELLVLTES